MNELLARCKGLHLLFVEDNDEVRVHTKEMLSRFFDNITTAENGKEGLAKFQECRFDLVLTDIKMPEMNGIEMARLMKESKKGIPILLLSAHNASDSFIEAIEIGIDGYLLKPLMIEQFIDTLSKVVQTIQLQNDIKKYRANLENMNEMLEQKVQMRTEELKHRLLHDNLTGLKNHSAMVEDLSQHTNSILYLIDIYSFNEYNELYGLPVGNAILIAMSDMLKDLPTTYNYAAYRVYGDGFVLLADTDESNSDKVAADTKILMNHLENFSVSINENDDLLPIESTVGMALGEGDLFVKAEMALKSAKKERKHLVCYSDDINVSKQIANTIYWKAEIKKAIENDAIEPYFQALVDKNGTIVKHEALIRLIQDQDGEKKVISPFFFLDVAMKTRQYEPLTRIMITKSFNLMQNKQTGISINLSFEDITNASLMTFLYQEIERFKIGSRLTVEILESETVQDYELVSSVLDHLRPLGISVAIDDFGSGFSNFDHILMLAPDYIKIDGSLIKNVVDDKRSLTLVKAITEFSKELGIKVVAEFVSSKEIFETLKMLPIDEFQGYYFSVPSREIIS